ncbi:fungal specific transcription factor, putative [Aspergillus udagawae]|nr:fungal specific transcription factor, putative [Aspergillus udagawae]
MLSTLALKRSFSGSYARQATVLLWRFPQLMVTVIQHAATTLRCFKIRGGRVAVLERDDLDGRKNDQEDASESQQGDHLPVIPLEMRQEKADGAQDQEDGSGDIQLLDLFGQGAWAVGWPLLIKCRPWHFINVDGLTAVHLYLVSVLPQTDPRLHSPMLAAALRIAQRMGLHNESTYTRYTAVEAEMRRRLWWSLVIFDHRMCEMSDYKVTTLTPTWDCRIPLNVNDFEIRPNTNSWTPNSEKPTEALFAVVRSELADIIRHTTYHITFVNPVLAAVAKAKDPGHMFISAEATQQTNAQRNAALFYALEILECDTRLRVSPLTSRYRWLVDFHVPALAYIYVLNDLKKRPTESHAGKAWQTMSENYEARGLHPKPGGQGVFTVFARVVLQAWEAREIFLRQRGMPVETPKIVLDIRNKVAQMSPCFSMVPSCSTGEPPHSSIAISINSETIPAQMNVAGHSADGQAFPDPDLEPSNFPDVAEQPGMDIDIDQFWTAMDWRLMHTQAW